MSFTLTSEHADLLNELANGAVGRMDLERVLNPKNLVAKTRAAGLIRNVMIEAIVPVALGLKAEADHLREEIARLRATTRELERQVLSDRDAERFRAFDALGKTPEELRALVAETTPPATEDFTVCEGDHLCPPEHYTMHQWKEDAA